MYLIIFIIIIIINITNNSNGRGQEKIEKHNEIEKFISQEYWDCEAADKLIITTEKDAQRLKNSTFAASLARTLLYVLPVETAFAEDDKIKFDQVIVNHVREYSKHS